MPVFHTLPYIGPEFGHWPRFRIFQNQQLLTLSGLNTSELSSFQYIFLTSHLFTEYLSALRIFFSSAVSSVISSDFISDNSSDSRTALSP